MNDTPHKNKTRAPIRPLNVPTLALSGRIGFFRPAPGTWGSLPPVVMAWLMIVIIGVDPTTTQFTIIGLLIVSCVLCVVFGGYGEERFGRKDAAEIVIDETAGQCLSLLFWPAAMFTVPSVYESLTAPAGTYEPTGGLIVDQLLLSMAFAAAFIAFRIADIFKPWPARTLEQLPKGWGVLIDDLVAGLYAAIAMQIVLRLLV